MRFPCRARGEVGLRSKPGDGDSPRVALAEAAPHPNPLPAFAFARRRASADKRAGRERKGTQKSAAGGPAAQSLSLLTFSISVTSHPDYPSAGCPAKAPPD